MNTRPIQINSKYGDRNNGCRVVRLANPVLCSLLLITLTSPGVVGCFRSDDATSNHPRLVPASAAEVTDSSDFVLEFTTKSTTKFYIQAIPPEVAEAIALGSPDYRYFHPGNEPLLVVPICGDKIVTLSADESPEFAGFLLQRSKQTDPELKRVLEKLPAR